MVSLRDAFEAFDEDHSGLIDAEELAKILKSLGEEDMTVRAW
jgi:Ca2+-binding EF-hand superfamily protein